MENGKDDIDFETITFTTKMGDFQFEKGVHPLSRLKLIVSTIVGQYYTPKSMEPKITDEDSVYKYAENYLADNLKAVWFRVVVRPMETA